MYIASFERSLKSFPKNLIVGNTLRVMKPQGRSDFKFTNWAQTFSCKPELYFEPRTETEIRQVLLEAASKNKRVKVVGCGHSPSDIMCTNDYMISMRHYNAILSVDQQERLITVQTGKRLDELNEQLSLLNLTLPVQGAVSDVTVGGVLATATHGSATSGGVIGSFVIRAAVMNGLGDVIQCDLHQNNELLRCVQCNLGALGVVLDVTIRCDRATNYEETKYGMRLDQVFQKAKELSRGQKFFEYFYYPHTNYVQVVSIKETDKPANASSSWLWDRFVGFHFLHFLLYLSTFCNSLVPAINWLYVRLMLRSNGSRVDRSDKVLNFECLFSQHVQEWSVPKENIQLAIERLNAWLKQTGYKAHFPWEVRFVSADEIYLSPAYGNDRAYMNIICYRPYGKEYGHQAFWNQYEKIMLALGGRPHWAKSFATGKEELRKAYPKWDDFARIRREMDPNGLFLNAYLERLF